MSAGQQGDADCPDTQGHLEPRQQPQQASQYRIPMAFWEKQNKQQANTNVEVGSSLCVRASETFWTVCGVSLYNWLHCSKTLLRLYNWLHCSKLFHMKKKNSNKAKCLVYISTREMAQQGRCHLCKQETCVWTPTVPIKFNMGTWAARICNPGAPVLRCARQENP